VLIELIELIVLEGHELGQRHRTGPEGLDGEEMRQAR
jgi:hypothetical protein